MKNTKPETAEKPVSKVEEAEKLLRRLGELLVIIQAAHDAEDEASNISDKLEKLLGPVTGDWGSDPKQDHWLSYWNDAVSDGNIDEWNEEVAELITTLRLKESALAKLTEAERKAILS